MCPTYADDVLAGGDGQTHEACPIDGHDAVPDAELTTAFSRASVEEVGHHHCGEDRAPARLNHRQSQDLPRSLGHDYLIHRHRETCNISVVVLIRALFFFWLVFFSLLQHLLLILRTTKGKPLHTSKQHDEIRK